MDLRDPRISPDGRTIAVGEVGNDNRIGVSLIDVNTGALERLTPPDSGMQPEWTRDGARVVFIRRRGDTIEYVSRSRDRSSADILLGRRTTRSALVQFVPGEPHGWAAMSEITASGRLGIFVAPMDSLDAFRPFAPGTPANRSPSISADGRLLAWASDESGSVEIYVQPITGGARTRVSVNGGAEPLWSHSGSTVFYRSATSFFAAELSGSPLRVVRRDSLFAGSFIAARSAGQNWAVFPNDKEFVLIRQPQSAATSGFVIINWPQLKVSRGGAAER
jgi:Tol biopolymer transport system component